MKTKQDNSNTYQRQNWTLTSADFVCRREKSLVMNMSPGYEPTSLRGFIASVGRYLKNLRRDSESIIAEGHTSIRQNARDTQAGVKTDAPKRLRKGKNRKKHLV